MQWSRVGIEGYAQTCLRLKRATRSAASAAAFLKRPAPSAATGTALDASHAGPLEAVSMAFPTYVFSLPSITGCQLSASNLSQSKGHSQNAHSERCSPSGIQPSTVNMGVLQLSMQLFIEVSMHA